MIGMSTVKLRDRRASKFGAMSGWEPSMPVSMMPTRVRWSPISTRWACGAPMASMSHWSGVSGSAVVGLGPGPGPWPAMAAPALWAETLRSASSRSISRDGRSPWGTRPITLSRAAPSMAAEVDTWFTNDGLAVVTFNTPTASLVASTRPPAARTAVAACAPVEPEATRTT